MAIYSCNLASIGRTTHAAGTAGAHVLYVTRENAQAEVLTHGMPHEPNEARAWIDRAEAADRKNARVADKIRLAIPRELDRDQRAELVREFCHDITQGRVPWLAAIHQDGKDAHNPHAHVLVRDRDLETGKRVLRLSDSARDRQAAGLEPSACEWLRARWEHCANRALERAGHEARIDRRTLEAQGIDREPTIHIGPRAEFTDRHVQRPQSKKRVNGAGREIDYEAIDQGRTRKERQAEIIDLNLERAVRSPDLETRTWARFEQHQQKADRRLEALLAERARKRTAEERRVKASFRQQLDTLRAERTAAYRTAVGKKRRELTPRVAEMRSRQRSETRALREQQSGFWQSMLRAVDITGGTRKRHQTARRDLVACHKEERAFLAQQSRVAWLSLKLANQQRFAPEESRLLAQRSAALSAVKEMHRRDEAMEDRQRQTRESERERARCDLAQRLRIAREEEEQRQRSKAVPAKARDLSSDFHRAAETDEERRARRREEFKRFVVNRQREERGPNRGR